MRRCHAHVHADRQAQLRLMVKAQKQFEEQYDRKLFMQIFGRNYLDL